MRIRRDEFEELLDDFLKSMDQPTIDGLNTYYSRAAATPGVKGRALGFGWRRIIRRLSVVQANPVAPAGGASAWPPTGAAARIERTSEGNAIIRGIAEGEGLLKYSKDVGSTYLLRRAFVPRGRAGCPARRELAEVRARTAQDTDVTRGHHPEHGGERRDRVRAGGRTEIRLVHANQLLRDVDWSSMAHGLEVRVPFIDTKLLERVGPAIASAQPPSKVDLAKCARRIPNEIIRRPKSGFTTPVRAWSVRHSSKSLRGLRGWADQIYRNFRGTQKHIAAA